MFTRLQSACLVFHLILGATLGHAAESENRYEFKAVHMGCEWRIVLYAPDRETAKAAKDAAFARVAELELVMSDYNPKSELMGACATNTAKPGETIAISTDLLDVLSKASEVSQASDGAFDVTIGPLVQLWRSTRKTRTLPDDTALNTAKLLVGSKLMALDGKAKTLTLQKPKMRLDLGGIGKGYAADEALKVLKARNISKALIAASGDITAGEAPPNKPSWIVEIAPLVKTDPSRQLQLVNQSVSTSGDLFQHVEIDGVRYSHVLDPKTGLGQTGWRSATVVMDAGWKADAYTKVAILLPPEQALKVIEAAGGVMTLAVKATTDAKPSTTESRTFNTLLVK